MMERKKVVTKDPAMTVAQHRLSVLELAEALGNVSTACKRMGMDRTSFYEWKRRFQNHGIEGLKDMPPIHNAHPQTTPPEIEEKIIAISLEHPSWGCTRLSAFLKLEGISVSSPTTQKILIKHKLGSKYQRWLKIEGKHLNSIDTRTDREDRKI